MHGKTFGPAILALVACFCFSASPGPGESYEELIARSETAYESRDYDATDEVLDRLIELYPDRAEPYWRKARNVYIRYEDLPREKKPDKDTLVKAYDEVIALSQKCMEKDPDDGNCYMWYCVGLGRKGTTEGTFASAMVAPDLEKNMLKGIELAPQYKSASGTANTLGDLYQMAGQFYRIVPEWACAFPIRKVVGTCGDLEKSVEYNRKAAERDPNRIEYVKELGISLVCLGQKRDDPAKVKEGLETLGKVESMKVIKKSDEVDKVHAKMLLQDPDLACGYSRDKQQDQSKEKWLKD